MAKSHATRLAITTALLVAITTALSAALIRNSGEVAHPGAVPSNAEIAAAVYAEKQLWLLHADGILVTLGDADSRPATVATPMPVARICRSAGQLLMITQSATEWGIYRRANAAWHEIGSIAQNGDELVAVACDDGVRVALVTDRRLIEVDGGAVRAIVLNGPAKHHSTRLSRSRIPTKSGWVGISGNGAVACSGSTGEPVR